MIVTPVQILILSAAHLSLGYHINSKYTSFYKKYSFEQEIYEW